MIVRNNAVSDLGPYGIDLGPLLGSVATAVRLGFPEEIERGVQLLLEAARPLFGPNEVAPGLPLFPEPVVNINDDVAEATTVDVPDAPYLFSFGLLAVGGTFGPTSELFGGALNLNFDRDADDDDALQLLKEIVDGRGGAAFDEETQPGVEDVALVSITGGSYTLAFDNGVVTDVVTFVGAGIENAVDALATRTVFGDGQNTLGRLFEDVVSAGGTRNPIPDLVTGRLNTPAEIEALVAAAVDTGDERVELLAIERDAVSVKVLNALTDAFDIVLLDGAPVVEEVVADGASPAIDPANTVSEYVLADVAGDRTIAPGLEEGGLTAFLATVDERDDVNAVDQGDSVRLEFAGTGGTRDIIVFETDAAVPGGAYDGSLFG